MFIFLFAFSSRAYSSWNHPRKDFCEADTKISHLYDSSSNLTASEVLKVFRVKELGGSIQKVHYGYSNGAAWVYLKVKKNVFQQKCIVEFGTPWIDHMDIYNVVNDKISFVDDMGDLLPFSDRFYLVRNYIFPFYADQDQEFLIKIKSTSPLTFPIKVQWRDLYINDTAFDYLFLGFFYGVMILFIFYGIHNSIYFRDKSYLLYSFFSFFMFLFFVDRDGILVQFLWPDSLYWKLRSSRVFAAITMSLGVVYYIKILRLNSKILKILSLIYVLLAFGLATLILFLEPSKVNIATIVVSLGAPLLMIIIPIASWKKDPALAFYFFMAAVSSFLGLSIFSLNIAGIIDANFFTNNSMKISTLVEFIFLTIAINKKIKVFERKRSLYKAVYDVSNMIIHDIKSPLAKINTFVRKIEQKDALELKNYVGHSMISIKNDLEYALNIVSNLNELSGQKKVNKIEKTNIKTFFEESSFSPFKVSGNLDLIANISKFSLLRIIENITSNAIQATDKSEEENSYWIEINEYTSKYIQIKIGNTGSSISRNDLLKVVNLFFTKNKINGTGIGLAYVDKEINKWGGKLIIESNGLTSKGKQVQKKMESDYVEISLLLPLLEKGVSDGQ